MSKSKPFDDVLDSCPNCGAMWGFEEIEVGRCFACGYVEGDNPDYEEDDEYEELASAAFGGHKDVWIEVDGHQQRVLGDPNMSEETKQALAKMIKAVTKAVENGDFDDDEPPYPEQDPAVKLCRYCHKTIDYCICEHVDD